MQNTNLGYGERRRSFNTKHQSTLRSRLCGFVAQSVSAMWRETGTFESKERDTITTDTVWRHVRTPTEALADQGGLM